MMASFEIPLPIQDFIAEFVKTSSKNIQSLSKDIRWQLKDKLLVGDEVSLKADNKDLVGEVVTVHSRLKPAKVLLSDEDSPSSDKENELSERANALLTYSVKIDGKVVSSIPGDVLLRTKKLPTNEQLQKYLASKFSYTAESDTSAAYWSSKNKRKSTIIQPPKTSKKARLSKKEGLSVVQRTLDAFVKIKRVSAEGLNTAANKIDDIEVLSKSSVQKPVAADLPENTTSEKETNLNDTPTTRKSSRNVRNKSALASKSAKQALDMKKTDSLKSNGANLVDPESTVKCTKSAIKQTSKSGATKLVKSKAAAKVTKDESSKTESLLYQPIVEVVDIDSGDTKVEGKKRNGLAVDSASSTKGIIKVSSVPLKQLTLFDLAKAKSTNGSFDGFKVVAPSTPRVVRRYRKAVKEKNLPAQKRLILMAAKELTDKQIEHLPDTIKCEIMAKVANLEKRENLKNMTEDEKKSYRLLLSKKSEDTLLTNSLSLPLGEKVVLPEGIPPSAIDDILFISGFIFSFNSYLVKPETVRYKQFNFETLCSCIGSTDERLLEIFVSLMQTLLSDPPFSNLLDFGIPLKTIGVNSNMLPNILHTAFNLTIQKGDLPEEELLKLKDVTTQIENQEFHSWTPSVIILALKFLCLLILNGQGIALYMEELREKITTSWKARATFLKQYNESCVRLSSKNSAADTNPGTGSNSGDSCLVQLENDAKRPESLAEAIRLRRDMAKKSAEERERKDELAKLNKERELLENQLQEAMRLSAVCKRLSPLGVDRNHSRYWLFPGMKGLFVEKGWVDENYFHSFRTSEHSSVELDTVDKMTLVAPIPAEHEWIRYKTKESIDALLASLNENGYRESVLLQHIRDHYTVIISPVKLAPELDNQSGVTLGPLYLFKEDLIDLEDQIRSGGLGGVESYSQWCEDVKNATSIGKLGECLLECQKGVYENRRQGLMANGNTSNKTDTVAEDEKSASLSTWKSATLSSPTVSRLFVLMEILRSCIMWDKSVENTKCRVCKRKGDDATLLLCDGCDLGFHMDCLRMSTKDIPEGDWFCSSCKPLESRSGRNLRSLKDYSDSESENSENTDVEEELCILCDEGGETVLCDTCLNSYHATCHQPPLRAIPRLSWTCHTCRFGTEMKKKKHLNSSLNTESQINGVSNSKQNGRGKPKMTSKRSTVLEKSCRPHRRGTVNYEESQATESDSDTASESLTYKSTRKLTSLKSSKKLAADKPKIKMLNKGEIFAVKCDDTETSNAKTKMAKSKLESSRKRVKVQEEESADSSCSDSSPLPKTRSKALKQNLVTETVTDKHSPLHKEEEKGGNKLKHSQLVQKLRLIINKLSSHSSSWPFDHPVDAKEVPDYYQVIKKPMDLDTIFHKLGQYEQAEDFVEDVRQMIFNSFDYNKKDSKITKLSLVFEDLFLKLLTKHLPNAAYQKQQLLFGF